MQNQTIVLNFNRNPFIRLLPMHCNPLTKSPLAPQTFASKRCLKPTDRWFIQPADFVEDPLPLIQLQTTMVHHPSPWSTASFCKPRFQNVILLSFQSKCSTILYFYPLVSSPTVTVTLVIIALFKDHLQSKAILLR